MPIVIPPFVAYQPALIPIAARWRRLPPEGDKFIACEIDWGQTVPIGQAVQFTLNAGPVEFSQICALSIDNGRSGGDVSFLFPDTGRQLTVPAFAQGIYPIFSNALTFYVDNPSATTGDVTVFEILNSVPPPVSVLPSQEQSRAGVSGIGLPPNAVTPIIAGGTNGTLQGFNITLYVPAGATGNNTIILVDGAGHQLWAAFVNGAATAQTVPITQTGLSLRFTNGLNFTVSGSTLSAGNAVVNVYYSVP